jgi:hypothetical protein
MPASSREDAKNKAAVMIVLGASEGSRVVIVVEDEFLVRMICWKMPAMPSRQAMRLRPRLLGSVWTAQG